MSKASDDISLWLRLSDGEVLEHPTFKELFAAQKPIRVSAGDAFDATRTIQELHFGSAKSARRHFK